MLEGASLEKLDHSPTRRSPRVKLNEKYLILSTISGAIITADQATKMWVHTSFQLDRKSVV